MEAKEGWVLAGLAALRRGGIDAVRIDRLAREVNKSKGSFHHHFTGVAGYHRVLLARFAADALAEVDDLAQSAAGRSVPEALSEVALRVQFDPALEAAVRAWAAVSADARSAMERVDTARLETLTGIWQREIDDPHWAKIAAIIPHLVVVGASSTQPTPSAEELAATFSLLAALIPSVPDAVEQLRS